eukprot:jgi/Psemu1/20182/gm1.20182_g
MTSIDEGATFQYKKKAPSIAAHLSMWIKRANVLSSNGQQINCIFSQEVTPFSPFGPPKWVTNDNGVDGVVTQICHVLDDHTHTLSLQWNHSDQFLLRDRNLVESQRDIIHIDTGIVSKDRTSEMNVITDRCIHACTISSKQDTDHYSLSDINPGSYFVLWRAFSNKERSKKFVNADMQQTFLLMVIGSKTETKFDQFCMHADYEMKAKWENFQHLLWYDVHGGREVWDAKPCLYGCNVNVKYPPMPENMEKGLCFYTKLEDSALRVNMSQSYNQNPLDTYFKPKQVECLEFLHNDQIEFVHWNESKGYVPTVLVNPTKPRNGFSTLMPNGEVLLKICRPSVFHFVLHYSDIITNLYDISFDLDMDMVCLSTAKTSKGATEQIIYLEKEWLIRKMVNWQKSLWAVEITVPFDKAWREDISKIILVTDLEVLCNNCLDKWLSTLTLYSYLPESRKIFTPLTPSLVEKLVKQEEDLLKMNLEVIFLSRTEAHNTKGNDLYLSGVFKHLKCSNFLYYTYKEEVQSFKSKNNSCEAGWVMFTSECADAGGKGLVLPWFVVLEKNNKVPVETDMLDDDQPESNIILPHDDDGKPAEDNSNKSDEGNMDKNGSGNADNKDANSKNNGDLKPAAKKVSLKKLGKKSNLTESGNNAKQWSKQNVESLNYILDLTVPKFPSRGQRGYAMHNIKVVFKAPDLEIPYPTYQIGEAVYLGDKSNNRLVYDYVSKPYKSYDAYPHYQLLFPADDGNSCPINTISNLVKFYGEKPGKSVKAQRKIKGKSSCNSSSTSTPSFREDKLGLEYDPDNETYTEDEDEDKY